MKWIKTFEEFGKYEPNSQTSPMLHAYQQHTPNGISGSYDPSTSTDKIESPLENEFKRFSRNYSNSKKRKRIPRRFRK